MYALWLILVPIIGWYANQTSTGLAEVQKQVALNAQETAVLKESYQNVKEQLNRIELVVNALRQQGLENRRR
jgi:hypothetical protein